MTERTGGCLCGEVRYRIAADPLAARVCWCRDCQHLAANGTVNAIFPSAAIEVTGKTGEYLRTADSGNKVRRRFCPKCASHLFSDSSGRPGFTVVRVGTLDDPSSVKLSANIWSSSAPGWACLDTALERFEKGPPAPAPAPKNAAT
ncbi:MAG TPA: GFA family protein [Usitatibacter sp.]|nr:GFA family protein [Usitatibacter sp.]